MRIRLLLIMILSVLLPLPADAVFRLQITPGGTVRLGPALDPDDSPFDYPAKFTLTVRNTGGGSVTQWYLSMLMLTNFISASDSTRIIPRGALGWKLASGTTYHEYSGTAQLVGDSTLLASPYGINDFPLDLRFYLTWRDPAADDYQAQIVAILTDTP